MLKQIVILNLPKTGVSVRPFRLSDLKPLVAAANNRQIWAGLRDMFPFPYTEQEGREWLRKVAMQDPVYDFALDKDGVLVGTIGFTPYRDVHRITLEVGYWVAEPWWGRGIATEALNVMSNWAFQTFPHVLRLQACVFPNNPASMRVLEKAGYTLEGIQRKAAIKDNRVMDLHIYVRLRAGVV